MERGRWLAGRELARSLAAGSLVACPPDRWLLARRSRARQIASSPGRLISDLRELWAADHLGEGKFD
ncbi:UNVERIFIED_CONTAM: hypothetical protein Slati_3107700 [Sesamum latifolium]|uniref:Uncharacterized protein n=1 Tax=Sesamum latifolium TaxID=2727402 RepID=A0AAW2UV97_9LAMI